MCLQVPLAVKYRAIMPGAMTRCTPAGWTREQPNEVSGRVVAHINEDTI